MSSLEYWIGLAKEAHPQYRYILYTNPSGKPDPAVMVCHEDEWLPVIAFEEAETMLDAFIAAYTKAADHAKTYVSVMPERLRKLKERRAQASAS